VAWCGTPPLTLPFCGVASPPRHTPYHARGAIRVHATLSCMWWHAVLFVFLAVGFNFLGQNGTEIQSHLHNSCKKVISLKFIFYRDLNEITN
jgi:hypothetical protein